MAIITPKNDVVEVDDITLVNTKDSVTVRLPYDSVFEIDGAGYITLWEKGGANRVKRINPFSAKPC